MTNSLTLSLPEIILFFSAAIVLGITIRLFIGMRSNMKKEAKEMESLKNEEWKEKYFADIKIRDKKIATLKEQVKQSGEKAKAFSTKAEELHWQHERFEAIKEQLEKRISDLDKKNKMQLITVQEKRGLVARG